MNTSSPQSFKALYNQYIEAFNAHNWKDVKAFISPDVEIYVRGRLDIKNNWEQLEKNYRAHWAMPNAWVEIPQLKEFENGVMVKVVDHARNKLVDITYMYALEDGKWLQAKHEIGTVTDYNVTEAEDETGGKNAA